MPDIICLGHIYTYIYIQYYTDGNYHNYYYSYGWCVCVYFILRCFHIIVISILHHYDDHVRETGHTMNNNVLFNTVWVNNEQLCCFYILAHVDNHNKCMYIYIYIHICNFICTLYARWSWNWRHFVDWKHFFFRELNSNQIQFCLSYLHHASSSWVIIYVGLNEHLAVNMLTYVYVRPNKTE